MELRITDIQNHIDDNHDDLMRRTRNGRRVHLDNVIDGDMYCSVAIFQQGGELVWKNTEGVFTVDV